MKKLIALVLAAMLCMTACIALAADLKIFGAVVISGPRWTGKTATAARVAGNVLMMQDPDSGSASLMTAELKPSRLLEGRTPRLIDEWQEAPQLWDAVRLTVDDRDEPGQFILTGSAAADRRRIRHSGTGRFCEIRMGTMTLFESGDSSGTVSLKGLFDGGVADAVCDSLPLLGTAGCTDYLHAVFAEALGNGAADAAACAGDDSNFISDTVEIHHFHKASSIFYFSYSRIRFATLSCLSISVVL